MAHAAIRLRAEAQSPIVATTAPHATHIRHLHVAAPHHVAPLRRVAVAAAVHPEAAALTAAVRPEAVVVEAIAAGALVAATAAVEASEAVVLAAEAVASAEAAVAHAAAVVAAAVADNAPHLL